MDYCTSKRPLLQEKEVLVRGSCFQLKCICSQSISDRSIQKLSNLLSDLSLPSKSGHGPLPSEFLRFAFFLNSAHFFFSFFLAGFLFVFGIVMIPVFMASIETDEFGILDAGGKGCLNAKQLQLMWALISKAFHFHGISFHISLWVSSQKFLFSAWMVYFDRCKA